MEALQNFAYNSCWYATFTGVLAWELLAAKKKENSFFCACDNLTPFLTFSPTAKEFEGRTASRALRSHD